jgi:LacI family transcriptional regulator
MYVTIHDVAEAAGVSIATASRALSGRRSVSAASLQAVLAASEQLGYRANTVARSLRTKSTATVGMVVPRISNPYFPRLVEAVERQLSVTGRELLLCDSQNDPDVEGSRVEALLDRRVDGLILIPCDSVRSAASLVRAQRATTVVQMDRFVPGLDLDFVGVDNELGMRLVVDHLRRTGHTSFALVSSRAADSSARARLDAYRQAVRDCDRGSAERALLGDYSVEWGREATHLLLESGPLPDALVCGADVIALGVNVALAEAGVQVPDDVAVTGFDDIAFASVSTPALTTLRQPADAIGAAGVRLLRARAADAARTTVTEFLAPELVVRGSSGPQPDAAGPPRPR